MGGQGRSPSFLLRQNIYPQILFGNTPEWIAIGANKTVALAKHHYPVKALLENEGF